MPFLEFRRVRSEEHTSELQSHSHLVCRLLLEKKKTRTCLTTRSWSNSHTQPRETAQPPATTSPTSKWSTSLSRAGCSSSLCIFFFFFNDTATPEFYTLSLHDALPI